MSFDVKLRFLSILQKRSKITGGTFFATVVVAVIIRYIICVTGLNVLDTENLEAVI